jgi:hypothetical protein
LFSSNIVHRLPTAMSLRFEPAPSCRNQLKEVERAAVQ